jgi:Short C-terminal domain
VTEPESLRISLSGALGVIRQARPSADTSAPGQKAPGPVSVVDELSRIAGMLDNGLLSREEFDQLKARLLGGR